jgi:hypothetical protein
MGTTLTSEQRRIAASPQGPKAEAAEKNPVRDLISTIEDSLRKVGDESDLRAVWRDVVDEVLEQIIKTRSLDVADKRAAFLDIQRTIEARATEIWPPVPDVAPVTWAQRVERQITPIEFVQKYYGSVLGAGLSQADIRRVDPGLYTALHNWKRRHGWPEGFDLPSKKALNDERVASLSSDERRLSVQLANAVKGRRQTLS